MQEDKDAKIIMDLMQKATVASPPAVKRTRKPKQKQILEPKEGAISVVGNSNVVAGGEMTHNVTNIHHHKPVRPKVVVKTADGVIDTIQKAELRRLRKEWMDTHNAVKKSELTYQAAWGRFNAAMKVSGYAELKPAQFEAACKWLRKQISILNSMASAPQKVAGYNNKRIAAIKARCKNQLGDEFAYRPYILKNFSKTSLADLDAPEMEKTYRYIMSKR